MSNTVHNATAEEARELAESSRDTSWAGKSFMKELFLGNLHVDWIDPYPETPESAEFKEYYTNLRRFLDANVDGAMIDATGEYPKAVLEGLKDLGAFGMKVDKKYGGLGLTQAEYCKALELVANYDGNLIALLSAHQSIGLPQPLKLFGTDEQKKKYLPRCVREVTAFALTEPDVGSDPARLATMVTTNENGDYVMNGVKLWCTNGTLASLMVVMARHADNKKISAFIVEANWPGVTVENRCRFMGLRALENGVIKFTNVVVPKENLLSQVGHGLRIALTTLNTGRLSLPAACVGSSRKSVGIVREFANERVQWGAPVGRHEAIAHKIADMAATTYAIESLSHLANELSMRPGYDIRLEASAAKEYTSVRNWEIIDDVMQIRGGRAYETELSLRARGEKPYGVERMMRDSRINRIFEGSSEIMHLFMAREALDTHLAVAGDFINPKSTMSQRIAALPKILKFYAGWYPKLWWGLGTFGKYQRFGEMGKHLRYAERATRRLARNVFHGMVVYQAGLEKRQGFLFRAVDIAMEILVLVACVTRTQRMLDARSPEAARAQELTELHAWNAYRKMEHSFEQLWANDDVLKYKTGIAVLEGKHKWLEADSKIDDVPPVPAVKPVDATAPAPSDASPSEGAAAK
jgi:alkylation response protein AidB-like acyl-CoA dehydrogenase